MRILMVALWHMVRGHTVKPLYQHYLRVGNYCKTCGRRIT